MTDAADINPFPGLRPFRSQERHLFFGREGQSEAILRRLRDSRVVVLVGPSGSGKSSLINAGLLPHLSGGFIAGAGSRWRIATCRPGSDPIGRLALTLCDRAALAPSHDGETADAGSVALMEVTLRGSSIGLIDAVRLARLPQGEQLILIVDQFEELFRYASLARDEDAAAFVKLLLAAARQREVPIFIVLGLRSDYMGDCARFHDLPELVMTALYLIPRMTRDQRRQAIEGPVRVSGATIAPRLVNRLLNDVGDNPDQLPILQHVLMRCWEFDLAQPAQDSKHLDMGDYDAIGRMDNALSVHADEAFARLPDERARSIAKIVFQALSGRDVHSREARRPASVATLAAVADVDPTQARAVIDHFRHPAYAFLTPPAGVAIDAASIIDISHESLIRGWAQMRKWVDEEAEAARGYMRLADDAALYAQGKQGLWTDPELQLALDWRKNRRPNAAWAARYAGDFADAMRFLDQSRRVRNQRRVRWVAGLASTVCVLVAAGIFVWQATGRADRARFELLETQGRYLAQLADQWTTIGDAGAALPLTIALLPGAEHDPNRIYLPAAELQLNRALRHLHERVILSANGEPLNSAAFGASWQRIVTASADGKARLWNAETGKREGGDLSSVDGAPMNTAAFSPDGRLVAAAAANGIVHVWDAATRRPVAQKKLHEGPIDAVSFSASGRFVVTTGVDGKACVWRPPDPTSICTTAEQGEVRTAVLGPDDHSLVLGTDDGGVTLRDIDRQSPIELPTPIHLDDAVIAVAFTSDGRRIVAASEDGTAAIYDAATGARKAVMRGCEGPRNIAISRDGGRVAMVCGDNSARAWEIATGRVLGDPLRTDARPNDSDDPRAPVSARDADAREAAPLLVHVAFDADGRRLVTASEDGTARVWDVEVPPTPQFVLLAHREALRSVAFSADSKLLVTASNDRRAIVWDLATQKPWIMLAHPREVTWAAFSPDQKYLVTASADGKARVWDIAKRTRAFGPFGSSDLGLMNTAVISPDGRLLAVSYENGGAWIWEVRSGKVVQRALGHDAKGTRSAVFSPDGSRLLTAHRDGAARIWDVASGDPIASTGSGVSLRSAHYDQGGDLVVTASANGTAAVWDGRTLQPRHIFPQGQQILYSAVFSPDGRRILTASQNRSARLLDAQTGELIDEPIKTGAPVAGAVFAPDGRHIAIASADGSARVLTKEPDTQALIARAKVLSPRCLSRAESAVLSRLPPADDRWCARMGKWTGVLHE